METEDPNTENENKNKNRIIKGSFEDHGKTLLIEKNKPNENNNLKIFL